ncbi:unnamed protein product [Hydatigera taeniaeformis]|uniref:tRNA-5-taurinomethyluridine 2-sulfurtransferase n=1 Tax=Hydatigena taeniaeformis TaxID=6205 RepID=A0A0R3XCL2_HYDTA|nr:unnamed protein product [Hydatigera taeniaeformis]
MGVLSGSIRRVACAISGGVDSAVSAYLLKRKGFEVIGVFMTNWDQQDESLKCSIDADREDAQFVCRKLGIEFIELNFVKEYWNNVFVYVIVHLKDECSKTVDSYLEGKTPNPDILCNRYVKFQKLAEHALRYSPKCHPSIYADALATGHYAQNSFGNFLENREIHSSPPKLLRSVDPVKDQTFWLCNVSWKHLQFCMFPVGSLLKARVKEIAASVGLERIAKRKEVVYCPYLRPTRSLLCFTKK